jgi:hypothetical protein
MEPSFSSVKVSDGRPDGLLACQRGRSEWAAFVEAKAGDSKIRAEQIQEYAQLASSLDVDAVISISNEFARLPSELPYYVPSNKLRKREVFHFSWPEVRAFLEHHSRDPEKTDLEKEILRDVVWFMWEPNSGIVTVEQMPKEWPEFVQSSGVGVGFSSRTPGITEIVRGWQQERRDLRNKLAHVTMLDVQLRHETGVRSDLDKILKADRKRLADDYELSAIYHFKSSKLAMSVLVELQDRKTTVSVDLPVPEGKGSKALTTWLARATKDFNPAKTNLVFTWKGKGNERAVSIEQLRLDPTCLYEDNRDAPRSIRIIRQVHDVKRFRSRKLFIADLEGLCLGMTRELQVAGVLED